MSELDQKRRPEKRTEKLRKRSRARSEWQKKGSEERKWKWRKEKYLVNLVPLVAFTEEKLRTETCQSYLLKKWEGKYLKG
ncbi:hypothetical protein L484_025378 [Morus notabilis]|uniref:Uncharacterized protein n=1 Tax=Morus notabilis TaxID=981085 RepID=W9RAG2_9ROSA|nr:hypothetical protein L484_025378 [Morus notabilis]